MSTRDFLIVFLLAAMILYGISFIVPIREDLAQKRELLATRQEEKAQRKKTLDTLNRQNDLLRQGDPHTTIRVARELFRYCRPGEKVYHFEEKTDGQEKTLQPEVFSAP